MERSPQMKNITTGYAYLDIRAKELDFDDVEQKLKLSATERKPKNRAGIAYWCYGSEEGKILDSDQLIHFLESAFCSAERIAALQEIKQKYDADIVFEFVLYHCMGSTIGFSFSRKFLSLVLACGAEIDIDQYFE